LSEGTKENHENPVRMVNLSAKVQKHLHTDSPDHYLCVNKASIKEPSVIWDLIFAG
jgi:hypothetical protein